MRRVIILASGNGTNFQAIIEYFQKKKLLTGSVYKKLMEHDNNKQKNNVNINNIKSDDYKNKVYFELFCNKKDAYVIKRAIKLNIKYTIIESREISKNEYNKKLFEFLKKFNPDLIVLAGYMKILPEYIVSYFHKRIINIHPSLLPAFPGLNSIEKAYNHGVKITGITIHFVDKGVDTGEIIEQECIRIKNSWSLSDLEEEIHKIEHRLYPEIIERILKNLE